MFSRKDSKYACRINGLFHYFSDNTILIVNKNARIHGAKETCIHGSKTIKLMEYLQFLQGHLNQFDL